jgi:hypothetical protein
MSQRWETELRSFPKIKWNTPYVALSYCWGGVQYVQLTRQTFEFWFSCGIPFQELPLTLQHAVGTTFNVGYRYFWADALCIIQDDEKDMPIHLSHMKSIYNNAVLTISASRSSTTKEGFLQERKFAYEAPCAFSFQFDSARSKTTGPNVNHIALTTAFPRGLEHGTFREPINLRSWTLQGDFLSPRRLYFGTMCTSWA